MNNHNFYTKYQTQIRKSLGLLSLTIEMRKSWWWNIFHLDLCIKIQNWESKSGLYLIYLIFTSSFYMVFLIYHCCFSMRAALNRMRRLTMGSNSILLPLCGMCHKWTTATRAQMDCSYVMSLSLFGLLPAKEGPIWDLVSDLLVFLWPLVGFRHLPLLGIHFKNDKTKFK